MTYQEIVQEHIDVFGVEPVITGASRWDNVPLSDRILEAIESGKPYVEEAIPEDTLV